MMGYPVPLLTDRYELTMLSSLLEDGLTNRPAVFETFTRRLPEGRRYGVTAGLGRLLPLILDFHFDDEEIGWLLDEQIVTKGTGRYLETFQFHGDIHAYLEGDLYFPHSPILRVQGKLGECLILETLILSVLNYDSAVAAAASRMSHAAHGKTLLEMGSRRVHEEAAVAASRAAFIAGFQATSNLAAGFEYGIPTIGTAAHAFTLSYPTELEAFTAQVKAHGPGTTLLVDTYDTEQGIKNAVQVAGPSLGAIRLDSGDPAIESRKARRLLDELGANAARIVVTGDLDEYLITALDDAPINTYGVGTRVATGSGHPAAGLVYKLVEIGDADHNPVMRPVAKKSSGKMSLGGRKEAYRLLNEENKAFGEQLVTREHPLATSAHYARKLQHLVMQSGELTENPDAQTIQKRHTLWRNEMPDESLQVSNGPAAFSAKASENPVEHPAETKRHSSMEGVNR